MGNKITSIDSVLSLTDIVERDMRKYGYNPRDGSSVNAYWSDWWEENDLDENEPLTLVIYIGMKRLRVSFELCEDGGNEG